MFDYFQITLFYLQILWKSFAFFERLFYRAIREMLYHFPGAILFMSEYSNIDISINFNHFYAVSFWVVINEISEIRLLWWAGGMLQMQNLVNKCNRIRSRTPYLITDQMKSINLTIYLFITSMSFDVNNNWSNIANLDFLTNKIELIFWFDLIVFRFIRFDLIMP